MAKSTNSDSGAFPGHDEGSNRPPNAPDSVLTGGSTFAPLSSSVDSTINQKGSLGTTGKPEGGE